MTNAAGPWIAVSEREPETGAIVLGRWKDGTIRVVEWVQKRFEGTQQGPTSAHRADIWVAYLPCAVGYHEWPTHWAEIEAVT